MTIQSGSHIGSYEILSPLGAGGMGEVWKAHDSRINRDVAIKVLPEEVTADPDRLARFEQEAQAAGALNHPNILTVFEMGTHEGRPYLVTELLEGTSLRDKLGNTHRESSSGERLPVRKALEIGVQIANGLAAAHDKGIVHRDLKPDNIFYTTDGRVKILDFGLAKLTTALGPDSNPADAETLQRHTSPGTVMGTAGYMAPEQVRGQNADHRVDIFACGVVLYEMLSGRRAFEGPSSADTMSAILKEDPPPLSGDQLHVPLTVDRAVRRCLEKEPSQRFQSARDLAYALEVVEESWTTSGKNAAVDTVDTKKRQLFLVSLVSALAIALLIGYLLGVRQTSERPATEEDVSFTLLTYKDMKVFSAAFAPDQRTVVFSATEQGATPSIYTISPDYPEPRDAGLPNVHLLAVSSQGEMAVLTDPTFLGHRLFEGTLARVPVGSTGPRQILEKVRQAAWSPDGNELAIIRDVDGVDRIEYPIGNVLLELPAGYFSDLRISPDGERIAFFEHPARFDNRGSLRVIDRSGQAVTLAEGYHSEEGIAWARDGRSVIYSAAGGQEDHAIRSVDLDGNARVIRKEIDGLLINDVNDEGVWIVTRYRMVTELWARGVGMDRERNLSWLDESTGFISRDGRALAFAEQAAFAGVHYSVCFRSPVDSPVVRLGEGYPWDISPDRKWVLARVFEPERLVAYPTGAGEVREIESGGLEHYTGGGWFPDSRHLLVCGGKAGSGERCYVQDLEGGTSKAVTPEGNLGGCCVSPHGDRFLVYDGEGRILVYGTDGGESMELQGLDPRDGLAGGWTGDGRAVLIYRSGQPPITVDRYDIDSGKRSPVLTISPSDRNGLLQIGRVKVGSDEQSYSYIVRRMHSRLFTVEGLR